ncbi:MSMEG_4193 family putative phosphomutase [Gordonia sp. X0973]|uniref:MSMEG_4193 family putative phosphomutase n=1 Tax=Gordonia sp. X0973 TaxID=2742602 RepID=UPI000F549CA7|nr:MSMEG_4193 family putative phosphomutase [Gordonia sp. X0973]QKT07451.1 MSMEG_4193 family putative phosphomutase [Gordonia sp. X0973]
MAVILVRHGRSTANTAAVLAGRTPGVGLDETGLRQARELPERLGERCADVVAVARSPLQRCAQTVAPLVAGLAGVPEVEVDDLIEVDYGQWTNRPLAELAKEPLWKTVQRQPSAAVFPGGEGLSAMATRAVRAVRELDARYGGSDGTRLWVACTHGDIIKAVIADAMGLHLDGFQRIVVEPASMSVVRYHPSQPVVHAVNNTARLSLPKNGDELAGLAVGGSTGRTGES